MQIGKHISIVSNGKKYAAECIRLSDLFWGEQSNRPVYALYDEHIHFHNYRGYFHTQKEMKEYIDAEADV
jgi:hypothetical protein